MLDLTFACHDYDHVRDIFSPDVVTEGIRLNQLSFKWKKFFSVL